MDCLFCVLQTYGISQENYEDTEKRLKTLKEEERKFNEERKKFTEYVLKISKEVKIHFWMPAFNLLMLNPDKLFFIRHVTNYRSSSFIHPDYFAKKGVSTYRLFHCWWVDYHSTKSSSLYDFFLFFFLRGKNSKRSGWNSTCIVYQLPLWTKTRNSIQKQVCVFVRLARIILNFCLVPVSVCFDSWSNQIPTFLFCESVPYLLACVPGKTRFFGLCHFEKQGEANEKENLGWIIYSTQSLWVWRRRVVISIALLLCCCWLSYWSPSEFFSFAGYIKGTGNLRMVTPAFSPAPSSHRLAKNVTSKTPPSTAELYKFMSLNYDESVARNLDR